MIIGNIYMKIINLLNLLVYFTLGLILGLGIYHFKNVSSYPEDSDLERKNYQMIYIFYSISKSNKEHDCLYKYYENGTLYSPWITATYINSQLAPIGLELYKTSEQRSPLLPENEFSKICGYKLISSSELVDKYDSRIKLKKVALDSEAPLTFKRLGFSCLFNDISPGNKLRKDFPARYFIASLSTRGQK